MNQDQFQSFWKNLKAPLQEKWSKLTDEDLLEIDGNMMKFNEVIDTRYGERKGEVSQWVNRRYAHWKELYVV
ncbi:MAG: hypothetical protein JSU59_03300 [Nitrospirota bacterium]|nr:MAG: hypothetical protein JSU59_03300 [Nitrospirota bacterium]